MDLAEPPLVRKTHEPALTPGLLAMTDPPQFAPENHTKSAPNAPGAAAATRRALAMKAMLNCILFVW